MVPRHEEGPPGNRDSPLARQQSSSDLTFITNAPGQSLRDRFGVLIRDAKLFDALVGYFYTSGFHCLYRELDRTERIRVLIGIGTGPDTARLVQAAREPAQQAMRFSHAEAREKFADVLAAELEAPGQDDEVEDGTAKFIEWLRGGKLQLRAYPSANLHAKLYIMTFAEGDRDAGRVITGSSNFSQSGLVDNLEFNVELKARSDYQFALDRFDELWDQAVDLDDAYIETIQRRTWLNDTITPHELYLKFLYEYFAEELGQARELFAESLPEGFRKLEYQEQAVVNARRILDAYGGVFLADVVGLGKTYMAAMLARQLGERVLVIAPPHLLDPDNPGSWRNVFFDFRVPAEFESVGKLDRVLARGVDRYKYVIVDEAHRFRTEDTTSYEMLAEICHGKGVILVTATPYNNRPTDILALLKLFQDGRRSTIPNVPDLERFFGELERRLRALNRASDFDSYVQTTCENSREIREKVMRHLAVRRTRAEIERYFASDITQRGLKFPKVEDPKAVFYQLTEEEDSIFTRTIKLLLGKLAFARYTPLLYLDDPAEVEQIDKLSARNLRGIMRVLLVKRLESSFHAFRMSLDRFIRSYELFIKEFDRGSVYLSRGFQTQLYDLLEQDDDAKLQQMVESGRAVQYDARRFRKSFRAKLLADLTLLTGIRDEWKKVTRDPKWEAFERELDTSPVLKRSKLIVFTESKDTAEYLGGKLAAKYPGAILTYTGGSKAVDKARVNDNFDARARNPRDDYRILVSTEVLSEGVNLHRSNVVINYDIPWNPTRLMQRVGRVNRVDTGFDRIHSYNFFPTVQSNDLIKLQEAAEAKLAGFIALLGTDARLLTEGEPVESHQLFSKLMTSKTITGEDEDERSELKYLRVIEEVRKTAPALFGRIRHLPRKARTGRQVEEAGPGLITYFRRGRLHKFYRAGGKSEPEELDFLSAAEKLETDPTEPRAAIGPDYHTLLSRNRAAFEQATPDELEPERRAGGRDAAKRTLAILQSTTVRNYPGFTDEQDDYRKRLVSRIEAGAIPKAKLRRLAKALEGLPLTDDLPHKAVSLARQLVPETLLAERTAQGPGARKPREVILSEYFAAGQPPKDHPMR
ncbi:MAG: helicase-related protein [bacterium]